MEVSIILLLLLHLANSENCRLVLTVADIRGVSNLPTPLVKSPLAISNEQNIITS